MVKKYVTYDVDHYKLVISDQVDDFPQYVHISTPRNISAVHTFNPLDGYAPFILGPNADGYWVKGLNADELDGYHFDSFVLKTDTEPVYFTHTIAVANTWESASTTMGNAVDSTVQYQVITTIRPTAGGSYTSMCNFAITNFDNKYRFVGYSDSTTVLIAENVMLHPSETDNVATDIRFTLNNDTGTLGFQYQSDASGTLCSSNVYGKSASFISGSQGAKGDSGDTGPVGPVGPTGPSGGPVGPTGPAGYVGSDGATGPAGASGAAGPTGAPGNTGPVGPTGPSVGGTSVDYTTTGTSWETAATLTNSSGALKQYNVYTKMFNNLQTKSYSSYSNFAVAGFSANFKFTGFPSSSVLENEAIVCVSTDDSNYAIRFSLNSSTGDLDVQFKADAGTVCKAFVNNI